MGKLRFKRAAGVVVFLSVASIGSVATMQSAQASTTSGAYCGSNTLCLYQDASTEYDKNPYYKYFPVDQPNFGQLGSGTAAKFVQFHDGYTTNGKLLQDNASAACNTTGHSIYLYTDKNYGGHKMTVSAHTCLSHLQYGDAVSSVDV